MNGSAQTPVTASPPAASAPPAPPASPQAPALPGPPPSRDADPGRRNQPGVYLGLEATAVPAALSDQLDLPAGFGLLVDYVAPGSPAEAAGVHAHDILKQLNDQILTSEAQLSILVRSFPEGQAVTLLVLRKGSETKLSATLQKRPPPASDRSSGRSPRGRREVAADDFDGGFHFDMEDPSGQEFSERLKESLERSRAQIDAATARAEEQAQRAMESARDRAARAAGSRLDFDHAHILLRDSTGRIEIRSEHGKRLLTLRDTDGKKVFEGPIDSPEQRKKIPADVLPQVEALERDQVVTFPKNHGDRHDEDDADSD